MASVDMCEHDWPGSGCKECRAEREAGKAPDKRPPEVPEAARVGLQMRRTARAERT